MEKQQALEFLINHQQALLRRPSSWGLNHAIIDRYQVALFGLADKPIPGRGGAGVNAHHHHRILGRLHRRHGSIGNAQVGVNILHIIQFFQGFNGSHYL